MSNRPIAGTIQAVRQTEGGGFVVRRPFPTARVDNLDPFLLLDEMGPVDYAPGRAIGAPDHPHRGFETVTYMMHGEMEHRDSNGGHGVITPGAVQWMTAGAGIVHSEMPSDRLIREGGRMHGFQLWVNLPAAKKMIPPRYQGYEAHEIPSRVLPGGGRIRVIAGEVEGVRGIVETTSPMAYAHATLQPTESIVFDVPDGHTALVHVFIGSATVNGVEGDEGVMIVGDRSSGAMSITAGPNGCDVLLLSGEPLLEPIARYGPFVMNTREEIVQAFDDHEAGRLGRIVATGSGVSR
jgi:redox-sensitive bicupin YhaK (pirin superfamily)